MTYRRATINTRGSLALVLSNDRIAAYLVRYGIVFIAAGVGCVINGGERGEGCRADATDGFLADLRTSTADILVQCSRTL